ncbi:inactive serine protease scarface-like isoform X2 [Portunus trituberculatus]|uniref:inactive serine protease scarface-like isoform X2 n=1 Tax=Portunus trituberculatus TaxID=210409 RepID=UPI001E1CCE20|nr:inactive serine protease scarface-like isoform X2 [Portunus trituberculatus]
MYSIRGLPLPVTLRTSAEMVMGGLGAAAVLWLVWVGAAFGYSVPRPQHSEGEEVYCECVPFYLCEDDVIITDGRNLIDVRTSRRRKPVTNVEECPSLIDVCCGLPPSPTTTTSTITTTTTTMTSSTLLPITQPPTLPPDTPCQCVGFLECPAKLLVNDGKGSTSLEFLGLTYSHSQCQDTFTLCCADKTTPTPTPTLTPTPMPTAPQCECVKPYLCDEDGYIIVYGQGLQDIRKFTSSVFPLDSGECSDSYFVCCLPPLAPTSFHTPSAASTTTTTTFTTTTTSTSTTTESTTPPLFRNPTTSTVSSPTTPTATTTPTTTTTEDPPITCGIRNFDGIAARIIGFQDGESQFGEFPWMAAVVNSAPFMGMPSYRFVGGGTLIYPRVVLTAAHKVVNVNVNHLAVRLGEWDTQKEQEPYPHQDIEVEKVVVHPKFFAPALFYDVALLFLKEEAVLAPHVNTLCHQRLGSGSFRYRNVPVSHEEPDPTSRAHTGVSEQLEDHQTGTFLPPAPNLHLCRRREGEGRM